MIKNQIQKRIQINLKEIIINKVIKIKKNKKEEKIEIKNLIIIY